MEPVENWRPVKGYEGIYEISDLGNARSLDRYTQLGKLGKSRRFVKGQNLRQTVIADRHTKISFNKDYRAKNFNVCNVVYEAFCKPIPCGYKIFHKDNNIRNNALSNLELREFIDDELQAKRKKNNIGRLSDKDIRDIRAMYDNGEKTIAEISKMVFICENSIYRIVKRKTYQWVT